MSQDCPQLALDDVFHIVSPSPAPPILFDDAAIPARAVSGSPEPLPEYDIVQMRRKVIEMRHIDKLDTQLTPREQELVEMVLRLTAVANPDSDQLLRQADTISALMQQRDLLLHQAEEQRLRWNSEKDGWARMAEALLAQQAKIRLNSERDEDFERLSAVESDNKGLRQRLNETQSRLQMLESELTRLRPLLLMQPLISRSPMLPPTSNPKTHYARRRRKDGVVTEDEGHGASEDEPLVDPFDTPSSTTHSQPTPRAKARKSEAPSNVHPPATSHKRQPPQKAVQRGLSADARVEHLLLAARKIGKHRSGIISGMMQHLEERERVQRREESTATAVASTPKTPKRHTAQAGYPPETGYVYMNGQMRPMLGMQPVPLFIPAYAQHLLQTPSSSTTAPSAPSSGQKPKQDAGTTNPQTPLDSLLSAARSMMHEGPEVDEDEEVDVVGESYGSALATRNMQSREMFGSPVPKRRKVAPRTDKLSALDDLKSRTPNDLLGSSTTASGAADVSAGGRVRSALDVLADQAAACSTHGQSVAPTPAQIQTKGNGKGQADTQLERLAGSTPKSLGKTKSEKKGVDPPSSVARSRSRTPLSDLDNLTGSMPAMPAGGSASEVSVDPGGRTHSASGLDPASPQTLDSVPVSEGDKITSNGAESPRSPVTPSPQMDDPGDVTPKQSARFPSIPNEGGTRTPIAQPSLAPVVVASSTAENECREVSPVQQHPDTVSSGSENGGTCGSGSAASTGPLKNKELVRVVEQEAPAPTPPAKRQRSPYVKWSQEEDDLLAQAVAKYGQKWDLVQKALPSRGYHQVRQRWLRKLGVFDSKPDLSSFQTAATTFSSTSRGDGVEVRGNPKLGLAPLSSERAFSGVTRKSPSMPSS